LDTHTSGSNAPWPCFCKVAGHSGHLLHRHSLIYQFQQTVWGYFQKPQYSRKLLAISTNLKTFRRILVHQVTDNFLLSF
jgi:hypothetical protein